MQISYFDLMLVISMLSMDLGFETIDELTEHLEENSNMTIQIHKK